MKHLTPLESALLDALRSHAGQVVTRETLLQDAWGYTYAGKTRTVDVHVQRLRQKIGPERIRTVYGTGYIYL